MSTFLNLYNQPPSGTMGDMPTNATSTSPLNHPLSADLLPNYIIDSPNLAEDLVAWARQYLQNNILHQPSTSLLSSVDVFSTDFDDARLGSEGSVVSFYSSPIKSYSRRFVREADQHAEQAIDLESCRAANSIAEDFEWLVQGHARMVVEHKGRKVFDNYCDRTDRADGVEGIRSLATANNGSGSALELDGSGRATGAMSILLKLGRQMIADNCQLGLLFGGHRFIVFAIYDEHVNGEIHHRMLCSKIHQTAPNDGTAGAIQVSIAALLGNKGDFFCYKNIPIGIKAGLRETEGGRQTRSKARATSGTKDKATAGGNRGRAAHAARVKMSYVATPAKEYVFERADMDGTESASAECCSRSSGANDSAADLVLYNPMGSGICGSVLDADLDLAGESCPVAAKFFDPVFLPERERSDVYWEEEASQALMFRNETEAYKRLAGTSTCLPFYGAFHGKGFTGHETYLLLLHQLSRTFNEFSDMSPRQRETAYESVLDVHRRGIHHGDIEARNFGLRAPLSIAEGTAGGTSPNAGAYGTSNDGNDALVIYDFSHSTVFEECDADKCQELQYAREVIIENCQ